MSFYVAIGGAICVGVGHILTAVSTLIVAVKGNQSEDPQRKAALRAAAGFLGISILFSMTTLISALVVASTKGCVKKSKILLIISAVLFAICYIIALVIIYVYMKRDEKAGNNDSARDLRASFVQPLVAIALYTVGFILLFATIGSKFKKLAKACKKFERVKK